MKSYWKAGLAAVLMLGIAAMVTSMVAAQTAGSTPSATDDQATSTPKADSGDSNNNTTDKETRRDGYLDALAANLGISRDSLDQALTDTALEMVDQALADGSITQEEADNIKERINSGDFAPFGPGFGHGSKKGFHRGFDVGVKLEDLATFLGVDVSVIHEGLVNEQSLAEIAEANGKSRDELKTHITSNVEEKLAELVADGSITQEQADEKLQNFTDQLDEMIDRTGPIFRGGPGHHGGPGFFHREYDANEGDSSTPGNTTQTSALTL